MKNEKILENIKKSITELADELENDETAECWRTELILLMLRIPSTLKLVFDDWKGQPHDKQKIASTSEECGFYGGFAAALWLLTQNERSKII